MYYTLYSHMKGIAQCSIDSFPLQLLVQTLSHHFGLLVAVFKVSFGCLVVRFLLFSSLTFLAAELWLTEGYFGLCSYCHLLLTRLLASVLLASAYLAVPNTFWAGQCPDLGNEYILSLLMSSLGWSFLPVWLLVPCPCPMSCTFFMKGLCR